MEKRGIIEDGRTPEEDCDYAEQKQAGDKAVKKFDHVTNRLADAAKRDTHDKRAK